MHKDNGELVKTSSWDRDADEWHLSVPTNIPNLADLKSSDSRILNVKWERRWGSSQSRHRLTAALLCRTLVSLSTEVAAILASVFLKEKVGV